MTARPPDIPVLNVIPLAPVDKAMDPGRRGGMMRAAVLQVMTHLAIERVPPDQRSPLFDAAKELLTQAGRSSVEMLEAVEPGPEQDSLFEELGLGQERRSEASEVETTYPYELRLPLAPYRFEWSGEAATSCETRQTPSFSEERYTHADDTVVIIRNYPADGSFHLMSDRGEIELIDNARDYRSPNPISVVRLP